MLFYKNLAKQEWNDYCREVGREVSLKSNYEFLKNLELSYQAENESFILYRRAQKEVVSVCTMFVEDFILEGVPIKSVSFCSGVPVAAPAINDSFGTHKRKKSFKQVIDIIIKFCQERGIEHISFQRKNVSPYISSLQELNPCGTADLATYGFSTICNNSLVMDLRKSHGELLEDMSSSHRKLIKRASAQGQVVQLLREGDKAAIKTEFQNYQQAHFVAAGGMTRPQKSFDHMRQMVEQGDATLFVNKLNGKSISFLLCQHNGTAAEGWSQVNTELQSEIQAPRHLLEWEAIKYYKDAGFGTYDLGEYFSPNSPPAKLDAKLESISTFKERYSPEFFPIYNFEMFLNPGKEIEILSKRWQAFFKWKENELKISQQEKIE